MYKNDEAGTDSYLSLYLFAVGIACLNRIIAEQEKLRKNAEQTISGLGALKLVASVMKPLVDSGRVIKLTEKRRIYYVIA